MVDLAVPRDIEPEVKGLSDVYLYTVDDLAHVVQTGQANRQAAVSQAEQIVDQGVQDFMLWMSGRLGGQVDLIQRINAQTEQWRATELMKAQRLLLKGEPVENVLQALSRNLTQKMLHGAYHYINAADATERQKHQDTVAKIFLKE